MTEVVTMGETMALWRMDQPGPPVNGASGTLGFGGADSNVAIGLARLGHSVRWISALGQDAMGRMIAAGIDAEGVETKVRFSKTNPTGLMIKSPSTGMERVVTFYRSGSAASCMDVEDISEAGLVSVRILHFSGITPMLSESCVALMRKAVGICKQLGVLVSFDVNHRAALWNDLAAAAIYREFCAMSDIVFGDREELEMIAGQGLGDSDLLDRVSQLGPETVVMKLGAQGAVSRSGAQTVTQPAFQVDVVDTVGAGDAFVAGYLSALLDGESMSERLLRAAYCGAQACTNLGDWEGSVSREQLNHARSELVN